MLAQDSEFLTAQSDIKHSGRERAISERVGELSDVEGEVGHDDGVVILNKLLVIVKLL
jgi:hypothetical protein